MSNYVTEPADDSDLYKAIFEAVRGLLFRQCYDLTTGKLTDPFSVSDTAIQALNKAIDLGGGHSLLPNIGGYWFVHYNPGIRISLLRTEGKIIIEENISRSLVIKIAEKCLSEFKGHNVQLSLF